MRRIVMVAGLVALAAGLVGCMGAGRGPGGSKIVMRVSAGSERDYVDQAGAIWKADQVWAEGKKWGAVGGLTIRRTALKAIGGTQAPELYLTERYSMTGYRFDVPNGTYALRLHFAETFEGITKAGERVFTVKVQGEPVLKDLDVLKDAGKFATAVVREIDGVKVTDGKLMVEFTPGVQNPEINAIEVFSH